MVISTPGTKVASFIPGFGKVDAPAVQCTVLLNQLKRFANRTIDLSIRAQKTIARGDKSLAVDMFSRKIPLSRQARERWTQRERRTSLGERPKACRNAVLKCDKVEKPHASETSVTVIFGPGGDCSSWRARCRRSP